MRRGNRLSTMAALGLVLVVTACADGARSETGLLSGDAGIALTQRRRPKWPVITPPIDTGIATVPPIVAPQNGGCVFQKADAPVSVAFCDTFDQPSPVITRSGELDQVIWGVSRLNTHVNPSQGQLNDYFPTALVGCGGTAKVYAPHDVRICGGRVYESANDMEGQTTVALYPKQPFDFTGRTGTVVFDASLDSQGPHAAWPEFWITDKPVPAPSDGRASNYAWGRQEFGMSFGANCGAGYTAIDRISTVRNYKLEHIPFTNPLPYVQGHGQCFRSASATGELNHVEIRMSPTHVDVWVTEPGSPTLKLAATADVAMPLTKGLIWLVDAHYNANKFDTQGDHTFAWDNVGFDGPKTYRDLGFDVPDGTNPARNPEARQHGFNVEQTPVSFPITGVRRAQAPTGALAVFNYFVCDNNIVPSFRFNGGPWHDTPSPYDNMCGWRAIDVSVPVSEVHDGANTIEFRTASGWAVLSNISLILVAGAPVP